MKKTKILAPILATATIGSMVAPLVMLTSCNKDTANVHISGSTTQTTSANITTATYAFNVKNYNETTDEIEPEIEDVATQDSVSIEILSFEYKDGKLYVTVSISKEDGSLNDNEEVSFSINFKCQNKESKAQKWINKIKNLKVRHHIEIGDTGHFYDTDTTKTVVADKTKKQSGLKATFDFAINELETWSGDEPTFDISKLTVKSFQGIKSKLLSTIQITDSSVKLVHDESGLVSDYIQVEVTYDTTYAHEGDITPFGLVFVYDTQDPETSWIQTIDGFKITFGEIVVPHLYLSSSRERHYYNTVSSESQNSYNYICFAFDAAKDYDAKNFSIQLSKTESVSIVEDSTVILDFSTLGFKEVAFAYEVKDTKPTNFEYPDRDKQNIAITVSYNDEQTNESWSETFRGFSFENWLRHGYIVSCDEEAMADVKLSMSSTTTLDDVFNTVSPFEVKDVLLGTVTIDSKVYELSINEFNYLKSSLSVPQINVSAAGEYEAVFNFIVHTAQACYSYTFTKSLQIVA